MKNTYTYKDELKIVGNNVIFQGFIISGTLLKSNCLNYWDKFSIYKILNGSESKYALAYTLCKNSERNFTIISKDKFTKINEDEELKKYFSNQDEKQITRFEKLLRDN
jgi:hypothetical protein